jgi:proteic killer suppression protein
MYALRYEVSPRLIRSFKHKGLERFFRTGSKAGIRPDHEKKLRAQLTALAYAEKPSDLGTPSWDLHPLQGELAGFWSIKVNGNWRVTFRFSGPDVEIVDYQDYH